MQTAGTITGASAPRRRSLARRYIDGDQVAYLITFIFASAIILITALLFIELYSSSALTRQKFGWNFLTGRIWDPVALEFGDRWDWSVCDQFQ